MPHDDLMMIQSTPWQVQTCVGTTDLMSQAFLLFAGTDVSIKIGNSNPVPWGTISYDMASVTTVGGHHYDLTLDGNLLTGNGAAPGLPLLAPPGGASQNAGGASKQVASAMGGAAVGTLAGILVGALPGAAFLAALAAVLGHAVISHLVTPDDAPSDEPTGSTWTAQGGGTGGPGGIPPSPDLQPV